MWDEIVRTWPWWAALAFLLSYEVFALWTQRPWASDTHRQTLSQMATRAARRHPWLPWVMLGIVALLLLHFWGCTTFGICIP